MQTKTSRFAEAIVSLAKKAVAGEPAPAYRLGKDGYADWVILAVQGFKEYLGHDYRKLMDVLREMPRVAESLGLTAVAADKGYDWEALRTRLRAEGITSLITQRGPCFRGWASNLLIHDRAYKLRSNAEYVLFGLRQRYGETLWARTWFGQFRELVMKSAVRNIERAIEMADR